MNIKEIVEGMTAPQVAQVIKDNFNEVDKDKANKTELNKSVSDLASESLFFKTGGDKVDFLGVANITNKFPCRFARGSKISVQNNSASNCSVYLYNKEGVMVETISSGLNAGSIITGYLITSDEVFFIGGYTSEVYNIRVFDIVSNFIKNETGDSEKDVMSQKATTEYFKSVKEPVEIVKRWVKNEGHSFYNEELSRYGSGMLISEKLDKTAFTYNPNDNTYTIGAHEWWYTSKTNVKNKFLVYSKIMLSNNPNIRAQAIFLDENGKIVGALFDRTGKDSRDFFSDFIAVPKDAVELLVQSEEPNYRDIYDVVEKDIYNVPYYYFDNSYIQNIVKKIENNKNSSDDTVSFAFVTDIHLTANAKKSPRLINYIARHTDLSFAVCGGDIPETENDSIDTMIEIGKEWNRMCKDDCTSVRIFPCRGNHDYVGTVDGVTQHASDGQTYNTVMGNNTDSLVLGKPSKMYYYFDIHKKNLRVIVLDWYDKGYSYMYMSKEQWDWLAKVLITDYRIVIFAHEGSAQGMYVDGENTYFHETLQSILKACKNKRSVTYTYWIGEQSYQQTYDFAEGGNIIAHIVGHRHKDQHNNDEGLLTIGTTCDALYGDDRKVNSITEQAFDVFTVDFKNSIIKSVRVGYGSDRDFTIQ